MESDCLTLLPSVCEVLSDSRLLLHDDTSLEKLLDYFTQLIMQNDVLPYLPYLLKFLQNVAASQTVDPAVFSFSLKLTGLLGGKEPSFTLLQERGVLEYMFEPDRWHALELWEQSSVRYGWLQGLWNMSKGQQSLNFFCRNGFVKLVLHLQNDKGLFITSLSSQVLAHVLNAIAPAVLSSGANGEAAHCCAVSTDSDQVTEEVTTRVAASLASEEPTVVVQALRLLATVLTQCREPVKTMLWKHVLGRLETLANVKDDSFTLPMVAVLQAVARSPLLAQPDCRVETLMDIMLFSRGLRESVQCATAVILQTDDCPEVLKRKATDVILLPLLCATASPLQLHEPDKLSGHISDLEKQLCQKALCVCLLTQSLTSITEHVHKKWSADIPVQPITASVIKLMRICTGHPPSALPAPFPHLIGCSKVQRCSIDLLGVLSVCAESTSLRHEAFTVLLDYLRCPEVDATVLKKTHQCTLKWLSVCSPASDLWKSVIDELFQLLKKHVCDHRWEVRDSTLEFITQLTANLKGISEYTETFHGSGMISVLFTSLSDSESYVQASAVTAIGEAVTTSGICSDVQEKAVRDLLSILSQDTQSFPHRAVVKVFITWLKSSHCCPALEESLSSVLLLGGNDFDWEVKVHTLELADVLMDRTLNRCPCHFPNISTSPAGTCVTHALTKLKDFGLFEFLFKSLFDCDRPVSEKSCSLLLKFRTFMSDVSTANHDVLTLKISKDGWSEEMRHRIQESRELPSVKNGDGACCRQAVRESLEEMNLWQVIELLDLGKMQHTLSQSSDHVINSPLSLMEDILFMTKQSEENIVDCY